MTDETQSDFPTAWRPDQDDPKTIKGRVLEVSLSPDFGFGPYPIVTIRNETGEHAIHAQSQVLRRELAKRRPGAGDEIEVTYLGKRAPKSGNGNAFHVYRVAGGKEPEFNWDNELPAEERDAYQTPSDPPIQARQTVPADPDPMTADNDDDIPF